MPKLKLRCFPIAALVFGQFVHPGLAGAQTNPTIVSVAAEPAAEAKVGKVLRAFRIADAAPRIDGVTSRTEAVKVASRRGLVRLE